MLPTKTELNFARKGNFDLYTITNLSFMDLAMAMKIKPNLFAVVKSDLANRDEHLEVLESLDVFTSGDVSIATSETEKSKNDDQKVSLAYDAEFDLKVR
jgi:hypothetical protein